MLVLGIETATDWCGIGLWDDSGPVAGRAFVNHMELSARLVPSIQRLLEEEDRAFSDVGGIAVSLGPGSFTGLRIGVATAKTLAQAAGLPVAGIETMDAMAAPYEPLLASGARLAVTLSARRDQYYVRWYGEGDRTIHVLSSDELRAAVRDAPVPSLVLGDAARRAGVAAAQAPPLSSHAPRALVVAELGYRRLSAGAGDDLMSLVPLYVGRSAAEERASRPTP